MKHKIKPAGILRAVSIFADGKSIHFGVPVGNHWDSKGCNRALSHCAKYRAQSAKRGLESL